MADLAANQVHVTSPRSGFQTYVIENTTRIYPGALVGLKAGVLTDFDDAAGTVFAGVVLGDATGISPGASTGLTGDTGATTTQIPEARVDESGVTLMHMAGIGGTPSQAKVGDLVFTHTSNVTDLTLDASSGDLGQANAVGYLSRFRSTTDCDVTLFTPAEFLAMVTAE